MSNKLPKSRLQRDLTDSTVLRNVGVALSHLYIGLESFNKGIDKLELNKKILDRDLEDNFMVVSEGIQTRLKVLGVENSYELLKDLTRGKGDEDIKDKLIKLINQLDIDESEKKYLNTISPFNYTGIYKL